MTTTQTPRPWYRRWYTIVPASVLGAALVAGTATAATATFTSHPATPRPAAMARPASQPPAAAPKATTAPVAPPAPVQQAPAGPAFANAAAVVDQYYQDITDHNYAAAWALGGRSIGGTDYTSWVAGYATTASLSLGTAADWGSGQVHADLTALQADGTVKTYTGTYTVAHGVIVSASIIQVNAPQAAPVQPQPGSADTSCGGGTYAGPGTSCSFAQNVAAAYHGPGADTETVYSPATGVSYQMTYTRTGSLVEAAGGNSADVLFYPAS